MDQFVEPLMQLEFDGFDDTTVDGEQPAGKGPVPPSAEEAGEGGEGDNKEDEELESALKKSRPPTVDEYQWRWNVSDLGSYRVVSQRID